MLLKVHGCQTLPIEATIQDTDKDDNKQTIHLLEGNYEIDDSLYMNVFAKDKLRSSMEYIKKAAGIIQYVTVRRYYYVCTLHPCVVLPSPELVYAKLH